MCVKYDAAVSEHADVESIEKGRIRHYDLASSLVSSLRPLQQYWSNELEKNLERQRTLCGNSLMSSALLVYGQALKPDLRAQLISRCQDHLRSEGLSCGVEVPMHISFSNAPTPTLSGSSPVPEPGATNQEDEEHRDSSSASTRSAHAFFSPLVQAARSEDGPVFSMHELGSILSPSLEPHAFYPAMITYNAVHTLRSYVLIIDPHSHARVWLRNVYGSESRKALAQDDDRSLRELSDGIGEAGMQALRQSLDECFEERQPVLITSETQNMMALSRVLQGK